MTELLYQLVYCSRNTIPDEASNLSKELGNILASARRNNVKAGITGALLFTASGFAQVLEGQRDAVEATFERIQPDMRHSDVTVLNFLPADQRSFPAWSMAFAGEPIPEAVDALEHLIPHSSNVEALTTAGGEVLRLLESMVHGEDNQISF